MQTSTKDIIVLDTDSMVYLACYKQPSFELRKKKLTDDIEKVIKTLEGDEIYALIKGRGNFRYGIADDYKGNRDDSKLDEDGIQLKEWVKELSEWAGENLCTACDNAEADDYVGIMNKQYLSEGHNVIMAHIDKDLNQLIGKHYNFNKGEYYEVSPAEGYRMLMKQCLTGDAADNIKGLWKVGPKTAEKLLEAPIEDLWKIVQLAWEKAHPEDWQKRLAVCFNLVYMRTDEKDLKELSWEEINERALWIMDTGM